MERSYASRSCFFLFSIILLSLNNLCFAWHQTGHMLVASVAYKNIDKSILKKVESLATQGSDQYPMASTFITSSVWADDIKEHGVNFFNNWHYQDTLFSDDGTEAPKYSDGKAVIMIKKFKQLLESSDTTLLEKSFALKLFIHLIGDIHQPMHCASRVTKNFPRGDMGGNMFKIDHPNFRNLHSLWDSGLEALNELPRPLTDNEQGWLADYTDSIMSEYSKSSFTDREISSSPKQWMDEGVNIVKNNVYQNIKSYEAPSQKYLEANRPIIRRQIALAGYRLANQLNCIYKSDLCIQ